MEQPITSTMGNRAALLLPVVVIVALLFALGFKAVDGEGAGYIIILTSLLFFVVVAYVFGMSIQSFLFGTLLAVATLVFLPYLAEYLFGVEVIYMLSNIF